MSTSTTLIVSSLLLPPGLNLALIALGVIVRLFSRWFSYTLIILGVVSLYLLSTPWAAGQLLNSLETKYSALTLQSMQQSGAQAIVVLTSGNRYAPEVSAGISVSPIGLVRENYAAELYKTSHLPIYLLGGNSHQASTTAESQIMKDSMEQNYSTPVFWIDTESSNTYEAAVQVKSALASNRIHKFYLVTSAWHMPRAIWAFQSQGLEPIAAPTGYGLRPADPKNVLSWIPQIAALTASNLALHEHVGLWWYSITAPAPQATPAAEVTPAPQAVPAAQTTPASQTTPAAA